MDRADRSMEVTPDKMRSNIIEKLTECMKTIEPNSDPRELAKQIEEEVFVKEPTKGSYARAMNNKLMDLGMQKVTDESFHRTGSTPKQKEAAFSAVMNTIVETTNFIFSEVQRKEVHVDPLQRIVDQRIEALIASREELNDENWSKTAHHKLNSMKENCMPLFEALLHMTASKLEAKNTLENEMMGMKLKLEIAMQFLESSKSSILIMGKEEFIKRQESLGKLICLLRSIIFNSRRSKSEVSKSKQAISSETIMSRDVLEREPIEPLDDVDVAWEKIKGMIFRRRR
ncbi:hypothetical protein ACFE04_017488 [Oxalis oulophora]